MTYMNRHTAPAVATSAAQSAIAQVYAEWIEARREWYRISETPEGQKDDHPPMDALMDRWIKLCDAMAAMAPASADDLGLLLHVWWTEFGPSAITSSELHKTEAASPEKAFIAHAWRTATGESGLPRPLGVFADGGRHL